MLFWSRRPACHAEARRRQVGGADVRTKCHAGRSLRTAKRLQGLQTARDFLGVFAAVESRDAEKTLAA
jgi:hypothetical protein